MKKFTVKVFTSNGKGDELFIFRATPGTEFTEIGVQIHIAEFMTQFEDKFFGANYRIVRTGKSTFNALPSAGNA